jgi:asparagine synthase (glutamine-hydrolysing)
MCGICGFWNLDGRKIGSQDLFSMTRALRHRGPDDQGQLLWDGEQFDVRAGTFGLGHTRLSILDLSPLGHQPMVDESGEVWTVFNGEIYNYREIADELRGNGHCFRSRTDTEVILAAYRQWGLDCVQRFNGMFAIALWDRRAQKLHLIRDRLGVKPLYYYWVNSKFAFASELKALLAYPFFRRELDRQSLLEYLVFQYVPYPRAIFKNTCKLAPGHVLTVSADGQMQNHEYWSANTAFEAGMDTSNESEGELLEELEELLLRSVRYRMVSDVPRGAFLSGGTDSSLIVALMQKLSPESVRTFSIGFEDPVFDEAPYAKAVANHLRTRHNELYIGPQQVRDVLPRIAEYYDEPFADTAAIPTMLLSEMTRSEVTVSLSGDGGDELFGGYTRYQTIARAQSFLRIPFAVRTLGRVLTHIPGRFIQEHAFWFQPKRDLRDFYVELMSTWDRRAIAELTGICHLDLSESVFHLTFAEASKRSALDVASFVDIKTYLVDCILTKVDRASMSVSLEAREPLLDYRLVEFAVALPTRCKIRDGVQKYILKKLLKKYVPSFLIDRPKHGFNMPLSRWLRDELKESAEAFFDWTYLTNQGIFDPRAVDRVTSEHFAGTHDHYPEIYSLIVFQHWYAKYMLNQASKQVAASGDPA